MTTTDTTELRSSFLAVSTAVDTAVKAAATEFLSNRDNFDDLASGLIDYHVTSAIENLDLSEIDWTQYISPDAIKDDIVDTMKYEIDLNDIACELDLDSVAECLDTDGIANRLSHVITDEVDKRVDAMTDDLRGRLDSVESSLRELDYRITALDETVMQRLQQLDAKLGRRSWLRHQWDKLVGKVKQWRRKGD